MTRATIRTGLVLIGAAFVAYALSDHPFYGDEPGFGLAQRAIAAAGVTLGLCALLPQRVGASVLLATMASLVALAVAELVGEPLLGPFYRPIYQADQELIFKFVPDRRSAMKHAPMNGGHTVTHRINSRGFRGPELGPASGGMRIMVYGDSFIHAYYTPQEETFVVQLGKRLQQRLGRPVEMINAGVSSYGPDQVALKMDRELAAFRPDLAIVAIYAGNDYGDLMRNKMFRLENGQLRSNTWALDPQVARRFEISQRESILRRTIRSIVGSMRGPAATPAVDLDFLLAESIREYDTYINGKDNVVTNTHVDYYSADLSLLPESESARYKIALMQVVMQHISGITQKHGVPLAFLFIPHPMDVTNGFDIWKPIDRTRFPAYDPGAQIAALESAARSIRIPFLSLFDLYKAEGAERLYLRGGDDHWNSTGQEVAAAAMAALIQERNLLASRAVAR